MSELYYSWKWVIKIHALNVTSDRFFYFFLIVSLVIFLWNLHKRGIDCITQVCVGRDSSVGIESCYDLDGPGSNPSGISYSKPRQTAQGLTQPPVRRVKGLFPGGKAARTWYWPPTSSNNGKLKSPATKTLAESRGIVLFFLLPRY